MKSIEQTIILQAITTKVIPATNTKGARIKATAEGGASLTRDYHSLDGNDATKHLSVATLLALHLKWENQMVQGATKDGYCFVLIA